MATFLLTGLVEFQEATVVAPRANGRTLNHSQFLEDKDAGDIVRMDLRDERFCRSPQRDNLAFSSSTFAVRAGHRRNRRPGDSCEADSRDFDGFAVEHVHASVIEDSAQQLGVPRLEIMIAQDRDHRNSHGGANIGDKCLCFVGKPVFGEIAAKQQYISAAGISANASCNTPRECLP